MRNKKQAVTISFTTPHELAQFVEDRIKEVGMDRSKYLSALIRHDRDCNALADLARKDAERLATPVAA